ncbi:MAG: hypothetical protein KGK11_03775 [Sphingomonadales bacterium]|nr:hypothetical protein [Sphingomonadales bacterium]
MTAHRIWRWTAALALALPHGAWAQPADLPIPAARTLQFPDGIHVARIDGRAYYVDAKGRLLYGMDMRILLRAGPDPALYCQGDCAKAWEPVLAGKDAKPNIAFPHGYEGRSLPQAVPAGFYSQPQDAPDWTIIAGPQGPQWVYKGWHMVFVRRGDARSTRYEGADGKIWNTLKFIAPPPQPVAPPDVRPIVIDGDYVLADAKGRVLFTGDCGKDCAGWRPYRAGMAAAAIGPWRVAAGGDVAQWTYQGRPVFIADADTPEAIPPHARTMKP